MFVLQSTYNRVLTRAINAEAKLYVLNDKWNALVGRINKKGGAHFLNEAVLRPVPPLSKDDLDRLVLLCHPDKHDGKTMATEMTQKLLAIKRTLTKELA